ILGLEPRDQTLRCPVLVRATRRCEADPLCRHSGKHSAGAARVSGPHERRETMKQRLPFWSLPAAIGLAAMIVASSTECAYARGRGGGFPRGGFSREGPAAAGSFASRSESMLGHGRGLESTASGAANRMESGERAQAVRQHETNALQSSREQAAKA